MHLKHLSLNLCLALAFALVAVASGCATQTVNPTKLVDWTVETSHPYLRAGQETEAVIHVDLKTKIPPNAQERIPLNISLVLDHSGSMTGDQLKDAQNAVITMLKKLHPEDRVSVIAFSTRVGILQEQDAWDDIDRKDLIQRIQALKPRGTTAMRPALQKALQQVRSGFKASSINRIILFSDGIPNDPSKIQQLAQSARNNNVAITTMGLGPYYNEDLMARIADTSGGNYRFIKSSDQIEAFFNEERESMERVVARNVRLNFNLGPGVQVTQTLGGSGNVSGRSVSLFIGELGTKDTRQVALRVKVKASAAGSKTELIDAQLSWEDVIAWSGTQESWAYLDAEATQDQALIDKHTNLKVVERAGRLQAAWEMERAIREYEAGQRQQARERLRRARIEYRNQKKTVYSFDSQDTSQSLSQPAPGAPTNQITIQSAGSADIDDYMEELEDELEDTEEESEKGKILIKKTKRRSRKEAGY